MFAWQSIATVEAVLTQLCLNAIEDFLIDDCLVLSLVKIGLVLDLSTVDGVGQKRMQTALVKNAATLGQPFL